LTPLKIPDPWFLSLEGTISIPTLQYIGVPTRVIHHGCYQYNYHHYHHYHHFHRFSLSHCCWRVAFINFSIYYGLAPHASRPFQFSSQHCFSATALVSSLLFFHLLDSIPTFLAQFLLQSILARCPVHLLFATFADCLSRIIIHYLALSYSWETCSIWLLRDVLFTRINQRICHRLNLHHSQLLEGLVEHQAKRKDKTLSLVKY